MAMNDPAKADNLQQKLRNYKPSQPTVELVCSTPILLLVGVSGAGKDSIKRQLLSTGNYHHIVSHTTRPPRENHGVLEQDGREYHFVDLATAERMLNEGAFVEAKIYSGNVYGTSAVEIQKAKGDGKIAVTDMEIQGVAEYKAMAPNVNAVFVLPPSYEIWQQRLRSRYDDKINAEDIKRRMQTAKLELQEALEKDYFQFVINDDLSAATEVVDAIAHGSPGSEGAQAARQLAQDLLLKI
jgi:guanylate kinase